MALSEVQRFMNELNKNREALEAYNERLLKSGSFAFAEPMTVTNVYYGLPMIPETIEDELLQKIVELDEKSAKKLERISELDGEKISLKDRLVQKFDELIYHESVEEHLLSQEESKRHHLFERLSEIAREEGFDISTDDLLYFIGKAVLVIIKENPEYDEVQIFDELVSSFKEYD
ncbi:hypothetical protein Q5O24_08895 [Eubacteriaceae bacterium ES3]|nr:hypothetical protein Q5O24_08895 [Eubacteriaceae bacterium ES3]